MSVQENDDQLNVQEDDDQYNPVRENDDQYQIAEQVNWVGDITSSNTRQCLDTSQTLSKEADDQPSSEKEHDIIDAKNVNLEDDTRATLENPIESYEGEFENGQIQTKFRGTFLDNFEAVLENLYKLHNAEVKNEESLANIQFKHDANILIKHESKKVMLLFMPITAPDHGMYSNHIMFKELLSFPWRPGDLCVVYLCAVMNIMVLVLTTVICVLSVNIAKAMEYNASHPCYCSSLFHSSDLDAKENKVGMFNGNLVVRNEVAMGYLFTAMQTKAVKGNVMKDIGPEDTIAANVKHRKKGFDKKHQLKVVVGNTFMTFASSQLFLSDVQQIYDVVSSLNVSKELSSFPWRPGDFLCLVLFAVKNIMVLLLMHRVCVLLLNNAKAKVFKKYSVGFLCYSLPHTFEPKTEEYKVDILNDKLVVRNEINMVFIFPALRARPVLKSVVNKTVENETVENETVKYETVENETVEYETMVCNKMPMFSVKMVSLLHSSNTDMVINEFPAVVEENKLLLLLFPVNTDFTGMETEPDALVDKFLLVQAVWRGTQSRSAKALLSGEN